MNSYFRYLISTCILLGVVFAIASPTFGKNYSIQKICFTKTCHTHVHKFTIIPQRTFTYPEDKEFFLLIGLYNYGYTYDIEVRFYCPNGKMFAKECLKMRQQEPPDVHVETFQLCIPIKVEAIKAFPGEWKAEVYIEKALAKVVSFILISSGN